MAKTLRQQFIAVFSDFYLFPHLLDEQGLYHDQEAIDHWLRYLQLDHKVTVKNGRLSTTDLSLGQRKRLALLHVCLSRRPLVLLDEWAADQDPHFRCLFYHDILPALKKQGKTIIAITHDDQYFNLADRVVDLSAQGESKSRSRVGWAEV